MTGLDKILKSIEDEAIEISERTINEAELKAQDIIANAEKLAEDESTLIMKNAEEKLNLIRQQTNSQIEIKSREMFLKAKRELIDSIINETKDMLCRMPDEEYFNVIMKLLKKYIQPKKGEILFSKNDLKRIPEEFEEKLAKLGSSLGADLKVSSSVRDISGGFILSYGDIEENCSFDALFREKYDILSDTIAASL